MAFPRPSSRPVALQLHAGMIMGNFKGLDTFEKKTAGNIQAIGLRTRGLVKTQHMA
jgi:hypothetical protein